MEELHTLSWVLDEVAGTLSTISTEEIASASFPPGDLITSMVWLEPSQTSWVRISGWGPGTRVPQKPPQRNVTWTQAGEPLGLTLLSNEQVKSESRSRPQAWGQTGQESSPCFQAPGHPVPLWPQLSPG